MFLQERFPPPEEYAKYHGVYVVDEGVMGRGKASHRVMHPLPRVGEITDGVDSEPRAAYFRQMKSGMYVRMELLSLVFCHEW